jgi:8-oxo-dGTP diphosphatase
MKEHELFYVGQKAFIEKDGNVLILNDPINGLDFPGGRIQIGESNFNEALQREVREETTLEIEIGEPFTRWSTTLPKNHRRAGKRIFLVGYRCNYASGNIILSNEHDSFRWVNRDTYRELDDGSEYFAALEKYFTGQGT